MKVNIDMIDSEACFDARSSERLTSRLRQDDVDGLIEVLNECNSNIDDQVSNRYSRVAHLCIILRCRRVLRYLARVAKPHQLLLPDRDGSNLLHCMAATSVLGHRCDYDAFQAEAFDILRDTAGPIELESGVEEQQQSLLHQLCLLENAQGLRPLEFAMLVGAYSTFQLILTIRGYLLTELVTQGIRVRTEYNLNDYDLMVGKRRDKNPMLMLSLIASDQTDYFERSGLKNSPVLRKWIKWVYRDMKWTVLLNMTALCTLALLFTPFSIKFEVLTSMVSSSYQLETGFHRYVSALKLAFNNTLGEVNITSEIEAVVRVYCSPDALHSYLTNKSDPSNTATLIVAPGWNFPVTRVNILENSVNLPYIMTFVLCIQLAILLYNVAKEVQFIRCNRWMTLLSKRRRGTWLVRSHFYLAAYALSFSSGLVYIGATLGIKQFLDCTDHVLGRRGPEHEQLALICNLSECSAVLYIFFTLFSILETYELSDKRLAFLCICFRRMLSKFIGVLPLFILWTYLVFGTLLYMTDFSGQEFKRPSDVFYSPLRLFINSANPSHQQTVVILHTLFVLVVSINVHNFLIAFVTNAFNEAVDKFDVIYTITGLSHSMQTWRLYSFLTRWWRLRFRVLTDSNSNGVIRVWSLKRPVMV